MYLEPVSYCSLTQPPPARPHGPVPTVRVLQNTKKWNSLSGPDFLARAGWASGLAGHLWACYSLMVTLAIFIYLLPIYLTNCTVTVVGCYFCRFTIFLPREAKCDEAHVRCDKFCIENNFVSWYLVQILFIFNALTWFVKSDSFSICLRGVCFEWMRYFGWNIYLLNFNGITLGLSPFQRLIFIL